MTTYRKGDDPDGGDEFRDMAEPELSCRNAVSAVRDVLSDRIGGRFTADECLLRIVDIVYGPGVNLAVLRQQTGARS